MNASQRTFCGRFFVSILLVCGLTAAALGDPNNPTPLSLPASQNWGTTSFTSPPAGFNAWNGLSGAAITTQALAETSSPTGDAPIIGNAPYSGGAGGCYGYAVAGNARFAINTSGNTTNGVNQLAMALNTIGQTGITLTYDLINVINNPRPVGTVCQYRVGTSGAWTTLSGTGNPYIQSGGTVGDVTHASITLPAAAENHAVVQIRWAVWRGTGSGNSSAFAVDNISVTASGGGPAVTSLTLSGGPTYDLDETSTATVTLAAAPEDTATVDVSSGAFATVPVTITAPATSGTAEVSMANAGELFTALAAAASGCTGSATSASFSVIGTPTASFAATGDNAIDDSTGNGNSYIDPGESGVKLTIEIINNGTANATGVSGTLSSLTGTVTVTAATQSYPDLAISATGDNTLPFVVSASSSLTCGDPINLQLVVTSALGSSTVPLTLIACPPSGGLYDPPADYYLTATGTGATLKANVHNIISKDYWNGFLSSLTHKVHSYDDARTGLQITDVDPGNPANLILIYTGVSVPKVWDAGNTWNREHQWPDSMGINGTLPAYGDLHHLRPCNPSVNSSRGNKSFGIGGNYWDPDHGQACRGRVARSMFYMNTRYNGTAPNPTLNLVLVNGDPPTSNQLGDLASLIGWHFAYPVDDAEQRRNQVVFSNTLNPSYYQGNRNPYIDHPEYVWAIYGTSPNDSTLYLGGSIPPDGSSTANVDLGRVIVNGPAQPPQTLTLNKSGATPTTYDVTLSGAATSNAAGPRHAFVGGAGSRGFNAGLSSTTGTPGLKSGAITIDNTDLTSAAAGKGSADGDDAVNVTETVLDHSNASFTTPADLNTLTIGFGSVPIGSGSHAQPVTICNLVGTPGFTAGLVLTAVTPAGDSSVLHTDIAPFATPLVAGSSAPFTATIDSNAGPGTYQATYTLSVSDENLPGAATGTSLVLTLTGQLVPANCHGDMNCDGQVTFADIDLFVEALAGESAWTHTPCPWLNADCNNSGTVTFADIDPFVARIGTTCP